MSTRMGNRDDSRSNSSTNTNRARRRTAMAGPSRVIWKGSISFGLVNIPVSLYAAIEGRDSFSFHQLCEKNHRIRYRKWCTAEDREVNWSEIKKGYKITKNNYIVVEKEDLDKIKIKTTKSIDIKEFIDTKDFDPIFVEKSYYIKADSKTTSNKAYLLFVKVLNETNKIAIGKVVLRDNKEHLVALRAYQRGIVMQQLHYLDEIKPIEDYSDIDVSKKIDREIPQQQIDNRELSLAKTLVENLTNAEFDISQYSDTYAKELGRLITAKSQGEKISIKSEEMEVETGKDLLAALKASLGKSSASNSTSAKAKSIGYRG